MRLTARELLCHAAAASVGIGIAMFAVLLLDRQPVVELDAAASHVSPDPARMGETISITWSVRAKRNCDGMVIPRVIDASGRIFEYARISTVYKSVMQPGERTFTKSLMLPLDMADGPARYEAVVIRWCNAAQYYLLPMIDDPFPIPFEVVK